jgi:transposase
MSTWLRKNEPRSTNIVRSLSAAQRDVLRALIVLLAAAGRRNQQIQEALKISKPVVVKWRRRFDSNRLAGFVGQAGRKRNYDGAILHWIAATACSQPPESVGTHWGVRTLAQHLGVGTSIVQAVLSAEPLQPIASDTGNIPMTPSSNPKMLAVIWSLCNHPGTPLCSPSMKRR